MTKRKKSNNDLHNTTQKTKDRAARTALTTEDELGCSGRVGISYYTHAYHPQYYMREEMRKEPDCNYQNISMVICDRYSEMVNQFTESTVKLGSDDFNLAIWNPWFNSFLVNNNPLLRQL